MKQPYPDAETKALNEQLYQKMMHSQNEYRESILSTKPEDALILAKDFWSREEVLRCLKERPLRSDQAKALLSLKDPLSVVSIIYEMWDEQPRMEKAYQALEAEAGKILRNEFKTSQTHSQSSLNARIQDTQSRQQKPHRQPAASPAKPLTK